MAYVSSNKFELLYPRYKSVQYLQARATWEVETNWQKSDCKTRFVLLNVPSCPPI